jgi:hypothetical protein
MSGQVSPSSPIVPSDQVAHDAAEGLYEHDRMRSGKYVLSTAQKIGGAIAVVIIITAGILWPSSSSSPFAAPATT